MPRKVSKHFLFLISLIVFWYNVSKPEPSPKIPTIIFSKRRAYIYNLRYGTVQMALRKAIPFHLDMENLFGVHAKSVELELWIGGNLLGALFCKIVYDVMKHYSPIYFGTYYNKLPKATQIEWDNRGFSTAHALVSGAAAGYLLFVSDVFRDSTPLGPVAFRSTILSSFTIAFSSGYFLADLGMILWTYPSLGGLEYVRFFQTINYPMVLHHFLSIGSVCLANYTAHAHFYILMVLFTEITTPLINVRWYLMASGMKSSKLYVYNGLALLVSWMFARVILFVYFFYHIYLHYDEVAQLYVPGFYFMFTAPPGLALMNQYWFYKIVIGAWKAVRRTKLA